MNKGVVLVNLGRLVEALPHFVKAAGLGHPQGAVYAERVRQQLGQAVANTDDPDIAFDSFQRAASPDAMRRAFQQHPVLMQMIPAIRRVIDQQVRPEDKPAFEQRLAWLSALVEQTQRESMQQLVALYQENGETGLRQFLRQQNVPTDHVDQLVNSVKEIADSDD